jgi:ribosomal protein L7/L12
MQRIGGFFSIASSGSLPQRSPSLCRSRFLSSDVASVVDSGDGSAAADTGPVTLSSPKLQGIYDRVVALPEKEVNILGAMIIQILGRTIFPGEFGGGGGMTMGGDSAAASEPAEEVKAKTIFDLKLVGFDAKAKIKVIKEVRAITGLGLKEAKDLVESAPKVIQKELKQDKADELKAQLEAVGAEIELV